MNMEFREKRAEAKRIKRQEVNRKFLLMKDFGFSYNGGNWRHEQRQKAVPAVIYRKLNYKGLVTKLCVLGFNLTQEAQ